MAYTHLTTEELSARIKFDPRTIRNQLKDSVLLEGLHYIRPFGDASCCSFGEPIEEEMLAQRHVRIFPRLGGKDGVYFQSQPTAVSRFYLQGQTLSGTDRPAG